MTIVKRGSKFRVVSEHGGKNLGEEDTKAGAVKRLRQVEWFKHHAKCIVDPSLVKSGEEAYPGSDGNIAIYVPVVFKVDKPKDKEAQKLDFPSTTKQMELRDVKQPQFPSTPFTGEAYSESFHNPRPSNSVKDETHVIVQGDTPAAQGAGPFRGEHGPDVQFKGSDYVPDKVKQAARKANARKSVTIAGRKVIIKTTQGSDNVNLRNYPIERAAGEPLDPRNEAEKRKDWLRSERVKEDVKAYDEAKRNYAPGNGPLGLAMDAKTSYLGRSMGKFFDDKDSMKVLSDKEIKDKQKADKDIEAPKPITRKIRELKVVSKARGIMKLILQYTQNQPLAAGFKPLLAHLVKEEEDDGVDPRSKTKKAMSTGDIAEKISKFPSKGPASKTRIRLMSRAAQEKTDNSADDNVGPHPDFGPTGGYKGDTSKLGKTKKSVIGAFRAPDSGTRPHESEYGKELLERAKARKEEEDKKLKGETAKVKKGAFKDKWIKQQEAAGKDPLKVPKKEYITMGRDPDAPIDKKEEKKIARDRKNPPDSSEGNIDKSRPNPIKGGIGDKLDYKDVDEKELSAGIDVEQEHVKNSDDDQDKKNVKAADIAMDHLEEDDKYYTHLAEMEREAKEEDKNETKKKKLLRIVDKSFVFKGKGDAATSEKKVRHEKALEGRSEKAKEEWKRYDELEKLSEIKGKELERKRY